MTHCSDWSEFVFQNALEGNKVYFMTVDVAQDHVFRKEKKEKMNYTHSTNHMS